MTTPEASWFAVRCVFRSNWPSRSDDGGPTTYEERITVWRAQSADEAIALAEAEAGNYAAQLEEWPQEYLGLAQCYTIDDAPAHGSEVFSLMRDSDLDPDPYLDAFFDTGSERTGR